MPKGWHQLEDEIYTELERIPPSYKAVEHHIGVYASNGNGSRIMRGKAPSRLLNHSILTPSLAASIFTAKYINAVPLNRISEGYGYDGLNISRQVMAGWMIRLSDYYLDSVHQMMKDELKKAPLIHCDESPFTMSGEKDANDPQSKNYMWVYHSPGIQDSKKIYLYEYDNGSRSAAVIDRYLEGYKGILVSDGYASYHTLDRKHDDLKVAGCWVHCKRKYAEIVKTAKKGAAVSPAQQIAREAAERIAVIFHTDNLSKGKSSQEILDNRQQSVKPLVDAFFAWVKDILNNKVISSTDLKKALTYSVNQEKYLRVFLESAIIPLDNNDAERSIKKFCVGKHSWHICYPAPLVPQIILISVKLNEGTDSDILMFFTAECLNRYLLVLSYQSYKNSRYLPDQSLTPAIITIRCTTTSLDREMLHQRYDNNYSTF